MGTIPCDILKLTALRTLGLQSNQLTGSIPDFTSLVNLTVIRLNTNLLEGSIPPAYGAPYKGNLSVFANWNVRAGPAPIAAPTASIPRCCASRRSSLALTHARTCCI